jgi:signal transduction histidine kinase
MKINLINNFTLYFILAFVSSCTYQTGLEIGALPEPKTGKDTDIVLKIKANNKKKEVLNRLLMLGALDDDIVFELGQKNKQGQDTLPFNRFVANTDSSWAFQLRGVDKAFVKTPYPTIRYTNLKGGDYLLVYRLMVKDSVIEQQYVSVAVDSTMGESQWFYPLLSFFMLLLIGVVVYLWVAYEFRQKIKISNIRNRIAGDLHDEIGSDLGSAVLSIKTVQNKYAKNHPELNNTLEEVKKEIKETAVTLRDSVWLIQPNNDSFEKLFDKIQGITRRILNADNIQLVYDNQLQGKKDWKISMERRRNVYLIIREAIHNIVKHAQATQVNITIRREEEGVRVVIADNGIGFIETELEDPGNGLLNFRHRAEESFIEFGLESTPSVGTTIILFIPEF